MSKLQTMYSVLEKRRVRWIDLTPAFALSPTGKIVPAQGFVYVFGAQSLIKVGMTRYSLYRRWHQIQVGNPWLEPPLYVSPPLLRRVEAMEKACHVALAEYRCAGEWFECDRGIAIETVRRICSG